MKRLTATVLLAALLSSCGDDKPAPPTVSGGGIPWSASLDEALSKSKASGKPVLLHFFTPE